MRRALRWLGFGLAGLLTLLVVGLAVTAALIRLDHVVLPGEETVLNRERLPVEAAFDILGRSVSPAEVEAMQATPEGRAALSPAAGAIRIDDALLAAGRDIFYRETFGNEVFFSDILGLLDGGLSPLGYASAVASLAGRGTTDLRVRLSRDVRVGDRVWRAGETVATGLDVPKGEWLPLGIRLFYDRGAVRVGTTCSLCHARVDPATGRVVEGAPNTDLNVGLLLALARNPAAVWAQTGLQSLAEFQTRPDRFVRRSTEGTVLVPDPVPLAATIRGMLGLWPRGSVDTTGDLVTNPTSIPTTFTRDAWPYGWSGQAAIGPFRGLASLSDVVHGLGNDTVALAPAARALFGVDPELYLATILQGARESAFRFEPGTGESPSDLLAAADPTPGSPGTGRFVSMPGFLRANYVTAYGLLPMRPGEPVGYANAALAAFQNRLRPPDAVRPGSAGDRPPATRGTADLGRGVFERAGCAACHSGPALTSHRVWPAEVIATEPSRARAFAGLEANVAQPQIYATDTPVPVPAGARLVPVPIPDEGQLKLAWAHNRTQGGYKVPGLLGLAWSAPYLHDGGVAMGAEPDARVGADLLADAPAEPRNSLRALLDRTLRAKVRAANEASAALVRGRVTGAGHAFWADREAGFTEAERDALVDYLLSLDRPQVEPAPDAARGPRP